MKTDFFTRSMDVGRHPAYDELLDSVMGAITDPKQMETYSTPEQIAEVVYEAATDGKDQLRYVAGPTPRQPTQRACSSEMKRSARPSNNSSSGSRRNISVLKGIVRCGIGTPGEMLAAHASRSSGVGPSASASDGQVADAPCAVFAVLCRPLDSSRFSPRFGDIVETDQTLGMRTDSSPTHGTSSRPKGIPPNPLGNGAT